MNISIFGLGYVGAVSLACLARDGHRVIGVDVDQAKLDLIAAGKTPVVEEGMVELMAQVVASGRVSVTTRCARGGAGDATSRSICVGTPSAPNGSQDQSRDAAPRARSSARRCATKAAPHVVRVPLDAGAGHRRGRPAPDHRARVGQAGRRGLPRLLPARVPARGLVDPRLRQAAVHDRRRQRASAPVAALRELFGHLPCEFHAHVDPRRRDGQVLLQQLPRAQDHVRQRDRRGCARRSASTRSR